MENKNVGYLLLGLSVVIIFIIFLFNQALSEIINSSCTMAGHESCTMTQTLNQQTYLSFGITSILIIISLVLIFTKPKEKIIIKKVKDKIEKKQIDLSKFKPEEKQVYNLIKESGAIFQADLIEKTGFGKAKITRIIDRLEGNQLVERKRRGMTNVVVLKNS
jgi:uncharacterized membrane protein